MKKLLLITHLFYPEVASTAQIYTDMAKYLSNYYDVTVICSVPCYVGKIDDKYKGKKYFEENLDNIKSIRVSVEEYEKGKKITRINHILSFLKNSKKIIKMLKKKNKYDCIFATSQPPFIGGLLGQYAKKKLHIPMIYNIQDFQPEQTIAVGYVKSKLILGICKKIDKKSCKKSDMIITVGSDMQDTLNNRFNNKNVPNNIVINNWIDEKALYPLDKANDRIKEFRKEYGLDNKFVIMYSGNIGLYYDLENIMNEIVKFKDNDNIRFAFVGDGSVKSNLEKIVSDNECKNVIFIPYQKKEDLIYSLNSADVHIVCNAKGIKGVSVPSKIYGILASNVPCIGILEKDSTAYNIIKESDCGEVVEPGDYNNIYELFKKVISEKEIYVNNHNTGYKYLMNNFTMDISLNKYKEAIDKLIN